MIPSLRQSKGTGTHSTSVCVSEPYILFLAASVCSGVAPDGDDKEIL
jgi:hypothetical protein